jgi:hypothetical protein
MAALEKRVAELEARPIVAYPPIVITVPMQPQPAPAIEPWYPFKPIWYVDHGSLPTFTAQTVTVS